MAFVDMGYQRLYRNKVKEGNSLKTDDITGAKPRRAVRDRDPLAFDKMNDLKATNGNLGMDDGMQVRPGAKNLDHYQRMIRNLPGGAEKWEGAYAMQMKNGDGVRGLMKYKEPNRYDVEITPKPGAFLRSPHHRDERSSPSAFNDFFQNNMGGVIPKSTKIAGERSLDASNSEFSKPFGRPGIEGIESEKLPTLPHPTRFRSPQVTRGRNENMNAIMSHM